MLSDIFGHSDIKDTFRQRSFIFPKVSLFIGPAYIGKTHTALNIIDEYYNGELKDRFYKHSDIYILSPEKNTFTLDLVNIIKESHYKSPFELKAKYYILRKVHQMNKDASEASLKLLEDSPDFNHFILLSDNDFVADPIKSRSEIFKFHPVINVEKYLKISDLEKRILTGRIGYYPKIKDINCKSLYDSVFDIVSNLKDKNYEDLLKWFYDLNFQDYEILTDLFNIVCQDLLKESFNYNAVVVYSNLVILYNKLKSSVNLETHFRNFLINIAKEI